MIKLCLGSTLILLIAAMPVIADDSAYNAVRNNIFWSELYDEDYVGLYCGRAFAGDHKITIEHVYPADWMAKANGCDNRNSCPKDAYRQASSDLHNLWPAERRYNSSRSNKQFGVIPGNDPRFTDESPACDFERTSGADAVVEPRDSVKGEIARSMLYMIWKYQLPDHGQFQLMMEWNFRDPPNDAEKIRYIDARALQGRLNPYIEMWM